MATDVETLSLLLEVQGQKFENQLKRQNAQAYRIFKQLEDRASEMETNVSGSFDKLAKVIGGAAVLNELKKLADTWQEATNKIKSAGVGEAMAGSVANEIADIATRSRTGFSEVADLYARLTRTGKEFGATQGEIAVATETVSKALKISGASASETQATLVQLGQALGSGRLQGDELRSILENAPVVAQAIAKEFGVAVGQLKDLGSEGKLVSDRVFKALVAAQPDIEAAFAKTQASISDSFTLLQNAALKFVGNSRQMGIAAQAASSSIQFLAKNIDGVATAAAAVGAVVASRLVAQGLAPMVASIGAAVTASTAASAAITAIGVRAQLAATSVAALRGALALVGGPVGAAILGTAAVVAYLATESSKGKESTDRYAEALKALRPPADDAKAAIKGVGDQVAETSDRMNKAVTDGYNKKLADDAKEARNLETSVRSAAQGIEQYGAAGLKADDKKRGLDLVQKGMEGNAQQALAAADELRKLGETNISFASAFGSIATMLTQLAAVRQAAVATKAALADVQAGQGAEAALKTRRDEQRALEKSGFKLDAEVPNVNSDPVLAGIRLQREVRLAQMDKDKKALQDKADELYKAAIEGGGGITRNQAETAAKQIIAAEEAQKGGGGKGPKSVEDKAEDRLNSYIDSLARQNLVLQAEIDNFGKSNAEKRAAIELAKAGVDLSRLDAQTREEVLGKLNKEIQLSEQLRTKKKELEDAQKAYNDASKFFGDAITDSLEDLIINGGKAEDVLKNLVKQLAKAALQAAIMGSGPLAGIFGTAGQNGATGGLFGLLGGLVKTGFADGGFIGGAGTGRSDSNLAWVSRGEHITNAKSAQKYAPLLNAINNDRLPKFANGGFVGAMSTPSVPSGIGASGAGPAKITINNTQSQNVQADVQQDSNGDISVMISAVEARMADNLLRGRGPMSAALGARQTNRQLRG